MPEPTTASLVPISHLEQLLLALQIERSTDHWYIPWWIDHGDTDGDYQCVEPSLDDIPMRLRYAFAKLQEYFGANWFYLALPCDTPHALWNRITVDPITEIISCQIAVGTTAFMINITINGHGMSLTVQHRPNLTVGCSWTSFDAHHGPHGAWKELGSMLTSMIAGYMTYPHSLGYALPRQWEQAYLALYHRQKLHADTRRTHIHALIRDCIDHEIAPSEIVQLLMDNRFSLTVITTTKPKVLIFQWDGSIQKTPAATITLEQTPYGYDFVIRSSHAGEYRWNAFESPAVDHILIGFHQLKLL